MQWSEVIDHLLALRNRVECVSVIDNALRLSKMLMDDETPPPTELQVLTEEDGAVFVWNSKKRLEYVQVDGDGDCLYVGIPKRKKYDVIRFRLTTNPKTETNHDGS